MAARSITIKIKGVDKLVNELSTGMFERVRRGILKGLYASGVLAQTYAKELILSGPKTGRIYKRYRPPRLHQASAPGEAPANDLGVLARSISFEVDESSLSLTIFAAARYARFLEYGTRRMRPRPFLTRSIEDNQQKITDLIFGNIKSTVKK